MISDILNEADGKMDKSVEATREEFAAIRAGRAHPNMFSKIVVDYYGSPTPLQQLASFTAPEARIILISPFDQGAIGNIERAILPACRELGIGLTAYGVFSRGLLTGGWRPGQQVPGDFRAHVHRPTSSR